MNRVLHPRLAHRLLQLGSLICVLGFASPVSADSYNVNAAVPYDATTQAAVFASGLDGSTVSNASTTVSGNCQQQNPATTVSIWRDGNILGSVVCNGSFSLQISLQTGNNTLLARTANASQIYGPDSQPITITLVLPVDTPSPPTPPPNPQTETPVQQTVNTNAGAASDLTATPTEPFSVVDPSSNNTVALHVTVGGGESPYTIVLNWGDGSVDTKIADQPGVYDFQHSYQAMGNYAVHGSVHDVLGAETEFEYAVISNQPAKPTVARHSITVQSGGGHSIVTSQTLIPVAIISGFIAIATGGYWLGLHQAAQQLITKHNQAMKTKNGAKPRRKKAKR